MVKRLSSKPLLGVEDFTPTHPDFNVIGVFNPGAVRFGDEVVLLVRVAESCRQDDKKYVCSPRTVCDEGRPSYVIDRFKVDPDAGWEDHRKPLLKDGRTRRLAFVSHLELVRLSADGCTVRKIVQQDPLFGQTNLEEYGVEDPRITKIDDTYYITYVSVSSSMGVCTSLMSTKDFENYERHGILFPCENKDVVLFPEKVGGYFYAFHRPVGHINISDLAIVSARSPDLAYWGDHKLVLGSSEKSGWYSYRVGAGTPPIRTEEGWLSIFHGVRKRSADDPTGEYTAGALLTALDEPDRMTGISEQPFFRPETDYETDGYVDHVVFPTGIVRDRDDEDKILVYYGCADSCVAVVTFSISDILGSLEPVK